MREELNAIMAASGMGLNPLNEQGIAATLLPGGMVFVYADEAAQVIRIYTHVVPWTSYYQSNPDLLYALLLQSGPNLRYPELHVGVDRNEHYLWLTMVVPAAQVQSFPAAYERFAHQAQSYKEEIIALINEAQARSAARPTYQHATAPNSLGQPASSLGQGSVSPEPKAPSVGPSAASTPQVDDVLSFFANPNMISV